jgi:hypothetical protein
VRDHIPRMSNVAARLKPIDLAIKDGFLIYLCYHHNLVEPEGGPRTRWAQKMNTINLQIGSYAGV